MRELSLHILDIVQNSISADATLIEIDIDENMQADFLQLCIRDNGKGMTPELLKTVSDPFVTTRTTRKVGLGLSLLKSAAEACGGQMVISSSIGTGTEVRVCFVYSHIDRAPLGDIGETLVTLIVCNPCIDFFYKHKVNEEMFELDTREVKKKIDGMEINNMEVVLWIKQYLVEGIKSLYEGVCHEKLS
ncbi:MAG: ATP-binding protein [Clostridia bacterium]